jgi:hypothetical protein
METGEIIVARERQAERAGSVRRAAGSAAQGVLSMLKGGAR